MSKIKVLVAVLTALTASFPSGMGAFSAGDPALPIEYVDVAYPKSSGQVREVKSSCNTLSNCYTSLQAAINEANLGDEIIVQSGLNITGPITLKKKSGTGWIVIKSSDSDKLESGKRVSQADAKYMAKVTAPGKNVNALNAENGAHHYRIVGLEFTKPSPDAITTNLVYLGDDEMTSLSQVPHHIVLDRIYAHGDSRSNLRRCVTLNSAHTAIINSYISDCHEIGADAQAIGGWNGPGPFKITNNYIEGSGENLLFGGASPKIRGLVPSDIEITDNYFFKPLSWKVGHSSYAGKSWLVKNLLELKSSRRVLIDNNVFENSWKHGQNGVAILFKSANPGKCSWCVTEDVTFTNNIVKNAEEGLTINASEGSTPLPPVVNDIKIANNLFDNINSRLFQIFNGVENVKIENNTGYAGYSIIFGDGGSGKKNSGLIMRNNIFQRGKYGIGAGSVEGKAYLEQWFAPYEYSNNILLNTSDSGNEYLINKYPQGTKVISGLDTSGLGSAGYGSKAVPTQPAPTPTITRAPAPVVADPIPVVITQPIPSHTQTPGSSGGSIYTPEVPRPPVTNVSIALPTPTYSPPPVYIAPKTETVTTKERLMRAINDSRVFYITEKGLKRWIPTANIFLAYGNRWQDVVNVSKQEIDSIPNNLLIQAAGDKKVYQIEGNKKKWIVSPEAFNRNGFRWDEIASVSKTELAYYRIGMPIR